jgi:uncharacterized membrane protein YoaK (UPF0700 family)
MWLVVSMSWAAGFVDVVAWLVLLHVFASHMTGNTAEFGIHLSQTSIADAFQHAWPVLPFVAGLIASAGSSTALRRAGYHSSFSAALIAEVVLLALFVWLGGRYGVATAGRPAPALFYGLMCLPAAAMGLQTVTVTRVHGLRVYTTYLTGSLAKFAESLTDYGFWFYDRTRGRFRERAPKALAVSFRLDCVKRAAVTAGLWLGFLAGSYCGALAEPRWGLPALIFPMLVLTVAIVVDLARPVCAAGEPGEKDSAH